MRKSLHEIIENNETKRCAVVERMWLNFFNDGLLEQGLITEEQHRKMKLQITTRKPDLQTR